MFCKASIVGGSLAALSLFDASAHAALVRETFNAPVVGEAAFEAAYPNLNFTTNDINGSVSVTAGGVLRMDQATGNVGALQETVLVPAGVLDLHRVTALVGAGNSGGGYNVGVRIGGNNIVFHPGLGGGALRVEGAGGFGNTNIGFTPANNTLHFLQVDQLPGGQFNFRLVDGGNPSNVFTGTYTNPASANGEVALRRSGPGDASTTRTGIYDALTVVSGTTKFFNAFDLDVANSTQFSNANPDFTLNLPANKTLDVAGGIARIGGDNTINGATVVVPGFTATALEPLRITADVGATNSSGNYNVGLNIGQNNIVFHPGFGGGAFRVEGPGGFGNTNIGFTPANNVLHHLEVVEGVNGLFQITFTDGANSSNVFQTSFTNLGSVGGPIGFRQEGPLNGGFALFDNLLIQVAVAAVPEPATFAMMILGGAALLRRQRKQA